jgi:hypothetical protein
MLATIVKRLVALLVLVLVLDGLGAFPPEATCEVDHVGAFSCLTLVQKAMEALPAPHSSIATIALVVPHCVGYCPLRADSYLAVVTFILADHTRQIFAVYPDRGRLVAEFEGHDNGG